MVGAPSDGLSFAQNSLARSLVLLLSLAGERKAASRHMEEEKKLNVGPSALRWGRENPRQDSRKKKKKVSRL